MSDLLLPAGWSFVVLDWSLFIAQLFLGLAMACAAWRIIFGPRAQDRVLGLDTFYVNAMLLLLTYGIRVTSTVYFEIALVIGLLGFIGTVSLSKFLMRGEVIE
ncbi:MAG: K+/H+ antiporter subunit F [Pseudochelatococcus sp.]|jgi:multicomponent K+:H+ antiporter subunit F|uniref:K+/H+ antiporter subunit F n=1 Tax=Pseudochelatococcus sp. TaxID=2020869 RepID=UPI003D89EB88